MSETQLRAHPQRSRQSDRPHSTRRSMPRERSRAGPPARRRTLEESPFRARVWKETLYLLVDLPVGVAGFTLVVTGLSVAVSLLITLLGIPLLAATLLLARLGARGELFRAHVLLDYEILAPPPLLRQRAVLARLFAPIRDGSAWLATVYFALMLPVGILTFTIAVTWWGVSVWLITLPAWAWSLPHGGPTIPSDYHWNQPWQLALSSAAGLLLILAAPRVIHSLTYVDRALLKLLGRPRSERAIARSAARNRRVT